MLLIQQSNWQQPDFPLPSYLFELFWWDGGSRGSIKSAASPQLASFKLEEGWLCYEDPAHHCISRREPKHPLEEAHFYHLHILSFLWSLPTAGSHRSCIWNAQLMAAESKPLWAVAYIPLKVINYL